MSFSFALRVEMLIFRHLCPLKPCLSTREIIHFSSSRILSRYWRSIREPLVTLITRSFAQGGCSPKFLIIDDGWQDTVNDFQKEGEPLIPGTEFASRLVDIKENSNFKSPSSTDSRADLGELVHSIKDKYGVKFVYMWHALAGYWGGVHPSSENMKKYDPKLAYPIQSPGNVGNLRDIAMDSLEKYGVGIVDPNKVYDFYNDLHSYLASIGVDGVKVDVQNVLETLGTGYGGRVSLTRKYQEALEQSVGRNFNANNLICCMSHNSDSIFSSKKSAVARASEDFMPREPKLQTLHIASVSFNSLLLGEIVVSDWDMFHSKHETAKFHGAARAVGGCAVYVSDKPGNQDFEILKKLVLPDGSILRARHSGRPTRDCLFTDPVMDGRSFLKIWNLNNATGILGVFNCQGAGSWPLKQTDENATGPCESVLLSGYVRPDDIEFLEEIAGENWNGNSIIYTFFSGSLSILPRDGNLKVSLTTLGCEIFTVSPIRVFGPDFHFALIGLLDMYNSGGAVDGLDASMESSGSKVRVKARGCGRFGVYSNKRPKLCMLERKEIEFSYDSDSGLVKLELEQDCGLKTIEFVY
ncbi:PREDICTED: probable galactinol--sucrose galactosyltransferase 2 isoform X2 [Tarenaya hassleriana]|uniref:probable galactinol--sucrose galactosyltransferase 2 isoform X2 n=1 Tax=Tarenaya hassleriana TaxID=28532 RepID=UPI0008FCF918|nr:PREDICTED: probable galactinol--sucrose galactosyltransferase 2 isoform X2 [Tarenaya hassleriana]